MFLPVLFQRFSTTDLKPSQGSNTLLVLLPVLGIHFLLREAQAQSVTQPDAHVTVSEAASLQLRCNYSSPGATYLFWYVQYPRQGLQLLLKYYSGDPVVQGVNGFEAEFSKSNSSFHLWKASVHWSDSAVYFCALNAQCVGLQGELNTNTHGSGGSDLSLWSLKHLFGLGEEKRKLSSPSCLSATRFQLNHPLYPMLNVVLWNGGDCVVILSVISSVGIAWTLTRLSS